METHRDATLAWLPRVTQTVQADSDLRIAAVVVLVTTIVTVISVSTNSPDVRRHKLVASQTFCKDKSRDRVKAEAFQKCANTNAVKLVKGDQDCVEVSQTETQNQTHGETRKHLRHIYKNELQTLFTGC